MGRCFFGNFGHLKLEGGGDNWGVGGYSKLITKLGVRWSTIKWVGDDVSTSKPKMSHPFIPRKNLEIFEKGKFNLYKSKQNALPTQYEIMPLSLSYSTVFPQ